MKEKKPQTFSTSELIVGAYGDLGGKNHVVSKAGGLSADEMMMVPTGPRETSAEEQEGYDGQDGASKDYGGFKDGGDRMGSDRGDRISGRVDSDRDRDDGRGDRRKRDRDADNRDDGRSKKAREARRLQILELEHEVDCLQERTEACRKAIGDSIDNLRSNRKLLDGVRVDLDLYREGLERSTDMRIPPYYRGPGSKGSAEVARYLAFLKKSLTVKRFIHDKKHAKTDAWVLHEIRRLSV